MGKMFWTGAALVALCGGWAGAADASQATLGPASASMTYATVDQIAAARTFGSYTGVGSLFVATQSTATTNLGYVCTGSLVAANVVMTAGHCLYDYGPGGSYDPVRSVTFFLPSLGEATAGAVYTASSWTVNPGYNGDLGNGYDLSLFTLSRPAVGHDVYGLYTAGDEIGSVFTRVGTGTIGGPDGTGTGGVATDFDQRAGVNRYELYGDDLFSDVGHDVLLSDFDDGTVTHDVFGQAGLRVGTAALVDGGVRDASGKVIDADSSPGDSGGPEFIGGRIAGVTSFGVTGAVIDGACGDPADIDPSAGPEGCTNSSIGEIAGDTRVAAYAGFINGYIAASVPEPSSWLTAIAGLGAAGAALRRRRGGPARALARA